MAKRDAQILEMVTSEKKIEVTQLAERLGVSTVTMRKDLDALQARGLIVREHGYAILANPNDVGGAWPTTMRRSARSPSMPRASWPTATPSWWRAAAAAPSSHVSSPTAARP